MPLMRKDSPRTPWTGNIRNQEVAQGLAADGKRA